MPLQAGQVERLVNFAALLVKWNRAFNLVSRQDIQRLGARHLLDSLTGYGLLRGEQVMDIGSGAGLPGIPLAIASPQRSFLLCDRSARRTRFIRHAVSSLDLTNVEIWQGDYGVDFPDTPPLDTVVARGVRTAWDVWDMVQPQLAENGRVLVYESTRQERDSVETPVERLNKPRARQDWKCEQDEMKISRHFFDIPGLDQPHTIACLERGLVEHLND